MRRLLPEQKAVQARVDAGGVKHDEGKAPMHLLDPYALEQLARVLDHGQHKYAAWNWKKGFPYSRLIAATLRHVFAFMRGEDLDPESGLPHAAHAMCCLMFLLWMTKERTDLDDRWRDEK